MLLTLSIRQPSRSKQNARIICLIVKITLITCKYNNSIYIARSCVVIEDLNFQNISCFELDRKSQTIRNLLLKQIAFTEMIGNYV